MNCRIERRPRATAIRNAPPAPMAAASVGVNTPPYMPPITNRNSSVIAQTPRTAASRSVQLDRGPAGRKRGRTSPMIVMVAMYMTTASRPGTMPAIYSRPTSCWVMRL